MRSTAAFYFREEKLSTEALGFLLAKLPRKTWVASAVSVLLAVATVVAALVSAHHPAVAFWRSTDLQLT